MGNASRKARKREGIPFEREQKIGTPILQRVAGGRKGFERNLAIFEDRVKLEEAKKAESEQAGD